MVQGLPERLSQRSTKPGRVPAALCEGENLQALNANQSSLLLLLPPTWEILKG